jgi:hypothetical protein
MDTQTEYEPFGPEWVKEVAKFPKSEIISRFANALKSLKNCNEAYAELQTQQTTVIQVGDLTGADMNKGLNIKMLAAQPWEDDSLEGEIYNTILTAYFEPDKHNPLVKADAKYTAIKVIETLKRLNIL